MGKLLIGMMIVLGMATSGWATTYSDYTYSDASGRAATADFTLDGTSLTLLLTNASTSAVPDPTSILTALLFGTSSPLTALSAIVPSGSTVITKNGTLYPAGTNVGSQWAYNANGVSSAGLGIFGPHDIIGGPGLISAPGKPPAGLPYGIVGTGAINFNNGDLGNAQLIRNAVQFTFTTGNDFTLADISNVEFQYGTSLGGYPANPVPEPCTLLLLGGGFGVAALARRRAGRGV
ncbi:PEP-CTERM sorting domain-containing protein [Oryzomonas sagensis]|uniref:PEP-CTERM sorting domain-containing protein n=1 Tax=Oryzomonas sagensis TaxID=2603857 RepID=A0ABQ6TPA7_9BACT|nr:XDD4 family exosortase-dependent surface protein [Oryzomonas sagensis]KAB0670463.1 PEP-CTERM sorting domain-containing protein [Oryzomonas sagensis]